MAEHTIRADRAPHGGRLMLLGVVALLASACVAPSGQGRTDTTTPGTGGAENPAAPVIETWRAEMLASVNAQRAATGAGALTACATLDLAAQRHSDDQAARLTMSHTGSDGSDPWTRLARAGYAGWSSAAENVAYGYQSVTAVMDGWMKSTGHRENILNPRLNHLGSGRATGSNGRIYWTQDFGAGGTC